jgi:hypothetical protein
VTIDNVPTDGRLIVDAANVVGSVPDGWWRDRAGAAARLRDRPAAVEVVLVVEGAARGILSADGVSVVAAPGSGDDEIARLVRAATRPVTVVTADRGLRHRVTAAGADVLGPGTLRRWLDREPERG